MLAPIALFVYNRLENTKITLEALSRNDLAAQSDLVIFSDGPRGEEDYKAVQEVRDLIRTQQWCGSVRIVESETNKGLARSIREGVDLIFKEHESVVVLEDDIETAPGFLTFMNAGLHSLKGDDSIMHIGGYVPESVFQFLLPELWSAQFMSCWGWATWKKCWEYCIWDAEYLLQQTETLCSPSYTLSGTIDFRVQLVDNLHKRRATWAIFWYTTIAKYDKKCLYPSRSLVRNHGLLSGENYKTGNEVLREIPEFVRVLSQQKVWDFSEIDRSSNIGEKYLRRFYKYRSRTILRIMIRILTNFLLRLSSKLTNWTNSIG